MSQYETGDLSKSAAQRRADRIASFREELAELEREGVLVVPAEERARRQEPWLVSVEPLAP